MGFASYYEDNLDARGESVKSRHRHLTPSNVPRTLQSKQSLKPLQQKATHNIRQDICRKGAITMSKRDDAKWADNLAFHRATLYGIREYPMNVAKPQKTQQTEPMESQFRLRRSADATRVNTVACRKKKSPPQKSQRTQPKQSLKPLQQKANHNIRQDIRRRELQKTLHVPVQKTQRVTTEEIQRRIQREIIRQSSLKE